MAHISQKNSTISEFCDRTGKYKPDAYEFITECVVTVVNSLTPPRHLSAVEVLTAISKQLQNSYGIIAPMVIEYWNIKSASDIGEIIFDLIDMQILSASADDKRSDFDIDFPLLPQPGTKKLKAELEIPEID